MKYAYPVTKMCCWLQVSRSGFYEWRTRPSSATAQRRQRLGTLVTAVFDANHGIYGHRRIHHVLAASGENCSVEYVRGLMNEWGLVACQPRGWRPTTTVRDEHAHRIPDLLRRDVTADAPGEKLVGDITYISTWEGWLYLATVIDCHTKMVAGYATSDTIDTDLIIHALQDAENRINLAENAIFHSDRGSQYTSSRYAAELDKRDLQQSVGKTGVCWDNSMAESFFGKIKTEWLDRFVFTSRKKARREVVKYIEGFYNRRRIHSGIDYKTPIQVYDEYLNQQAAA